MDEVTRWIVENAHPLATVDPGAPLDDLEPLVDMVAGASVVGLARASHGAHELSALSHRVVRLLVERLGFRSLAIEEDATTAIPLDDHLQTGSGDLRALIDSANRHNQTDELLDVLRWMRARNELHPSDVVRFVGLDISSTNPTAPMSYIEARLADNLIRWHEDTGHKIVYWSGSHSAVGHERTVSFPPASPKTSRNAGSYLRDRFGTSYVSVGLFFHHGSVPVAVPAPAPQHIDALLGGTDLASYLLDLRVVQPDLVRARLHAPATMRLIGPGYDPAVDDHQMSGGSLADWFDLVVHHRDVTPTHPVPRALGRPSRRRRRG